MGKSERVLQQILGPQAFLVSKPLELARLDRLRDRTEPVLLVSADLDNPLPAWRKTPEGQRLQDKVQAWRALGELVLAHPELARALAGTRTWLPTRQALRSPRLRPPLDLLVEALGWHSRNKLNWTFSSKEGLLATLYAFNALTHEGLQLRLTHDGLLAWPSLDPGPQAHLDKRYPVVWSLRPEDVPGLVRGLE